LANRLKMVASHYRLVSQPAWQECSDRQRKACQLVGKAAVFPGLKPELEHDRLVRANERIKMLNEIEHLASQYESIKAQWKEMTGQEYELI